MPMKLATSDRTLAGPLYRAVIIAGAASIAMASVAVGPAASSGPSASPAALGSPAASPVPGAGPLAATVDVRSFDLGFTPTSIELPATGTSRIVLTNIGGVVHNLTVDALGIVAVASRGRTGDAFVTDPPPGTYEFYCSVSGHREGGMIGTLVVLESAPVGPTGAPSPSAATLTVTASG